MTTKRTLALAALLVVGTSATTGLARRNPEEALTDRTMISKTVWMGIKCALLQQYLRHVAPQMKSRISDMGSDADVTDMVMDAIAAGWFVTQMKDYFECVAEYTWDKVEPIANELPEPVRSVICDC